MKLLLAAAAADAGYGRCWWARTLAAESTAPEAALHRAAAMASLRRRCLLPSKLAAALSQDHAAAAASLQGSAFIQKAHWLCLCNSQMDYSMLVGISHKQLQLSLKGILPLNFGCSRSMDFARHGMLRVALLVGDTERVPSLLGMDLGADIETAALEESQASRLLKCCDMLQSATFAAASTVQVPFRLMMVNLKNIAMMWYIMKAELQRPALSRQPHSSRDCEA